MTIEEREAAYKEARERIFQDFKPANAATLSSSSSSSAAGAALNAAGPANAAGSTSSPAGSTISAPGGSTATEDGMTIPPSCRGEAEREMEDAKILFEQLSNQLLEKLPQRIDLRIPYLDPSVEAMVRMQARLAGYEKMGGVSAILCQGRARRVEGVLQEMRELSICGTGN
ncbi:BAR adaptor protein Hob3 [Tilletia horrida]|nr:BAR adaptor protein Hob3 [Tilletia horrida]